MSSQFNRPGGKSTTSALNQTAVAPATAGEVDYPAGMVYEPMHYPPDLLLKLAKLIFWVGGIGIGNGGQCITTVVSLLILQYQNPVFFLAGLATYFASHGLSGGGLIAVQIVLYVLDFLIRLIVSGALAILFQFGMALAVVNTTGTWGRMLFTQQDAQAALLTGQAAQEQGKKKRKISLIVGALLLFEGIVAVGDVLSDGKFASSLSPDPWFIIIFTAGLSFATLILTPVGWMLKTYAEVKLEEAELLAQALLQQQGGTPNAAAQGA